MFQILGTTKGKTTQDAYVPVLLTWISKQMCKDIKRDFY